MKPISEMTASEALAEWKKWDKKAYPLGPNQFYEKRDAAAARLDHLLAESGISIVDGIFRYNATQVNRGYNVVMPMVPYRTIPALDQHALEEWLLRKEGLK